MSENQQCCSHLNVGWKTEETPNGLTRGWWECLSGCGCKFIPTKLHSFVVDDLTAKLDEANRKIVLESKQSTTFEEWWDKPESGVVTDDDLISFKKGWDAAIATKDAAIATLKAEKEQAEADSLARLLMLIEMLERFGVDEVTISCLHACKQEVDKVMLKEAEWWRERDGGTGTSPDKMKRIAKLRAAVKGEKQ